MKPDNWLIGGQQSGLHFYGHIMADDRLPPFHTRKPCI
jgi:hypothetical protein